MPKQPQLLTVGHLAPNPDWSISSQGHACHELIVVMRGKMHLRCPDGSVLLEAGDVVIYPAGMPHAERSDPDDPVESYFCQLTYPLAAGTGLLRRHDHSGRLRQIIHWLHFDQGDRDPRTIAERNALFEALMSRFFIDSKGSDAEMVRRLRAFVNSHLDQDLTLSRLARECALSPFHFARTYRRLTGMPPMKDVRCIRLNVARDLIMTCGLSLKEIAQKTGFGNPYSFSRLFRRHFGMPPGEFRRRLGHGDFTGPSPSTQNPPVMFSP
jgi:AraC family transcriptional regulator of arabinose operon